MINPNGDEFMEDDPMRANEERISAENPGRLRQAAEKVSTVAGDAWEQTKVRASTARERTEFFLRENPVPTILGALGLGIAIGLAIRYASASERKTEIEVKSPLGNVNWSMLSLPFLWPLFKSAREKYDRSADAVADAMKDGVKRLKKIDVDRYAKPIRKRWKAWKR